MMYTSLNSQYYLNTKTTVLQDMYLYYQNNNNYFFNFNFPYFPIIEVMYTKAHKSRFRIGNFKGNKSKV